MRGLLSVLVAVVFLIPAYGAAHAETTATEAAALSAARNDHTAYTLPPDKLVKAEALTRTRHGVYWADTIWGILSLWLILKLGIVAQMRNLAMNFSRNRWAQGFLFLLEFLVITFLLGLPIDLYDQHVQRAYGLSVQGWGSWFGDQGKTFALVYLFGGLLMMLLFSLIRKFQRRWWIWIAGAVMIVAALADFAFPYGAFLFNHFEPLTQSNPALVDQLERVVAKGHGITIPPERMYLMKASEKTTELNAYVAGFGASKRVVVWDTSIEKGTPDEILLIFGHEMGHYVLGHIVSGLLFGWAGILVSFYAGFHLFQWLLRRYGPGWQIPAQDDWAALVVLILVLDVIGFVSSPIDNGFSRMHEHAADVYGMEVVHGIVKDPQATGQAAFQVLGENSFVDPKPAPFYEFWTGSHPPIWLRAAFAKHYDPWAPGAEPKYFSK
jgi:STE24 endopeptidase